MDRGDIAIAGTNDPQIYRSVRYSLAGYNLPVANGNYTVRLHFAETANAVSAAGQRVFGVIVEGTTLADVDALAETGAKNTALVRSVDVSVADGNLDIDFLPKVYNAMVCGIEVLPR